MAKKRKSSSKSSKGATTLKKITRLAKQKYNKKGNRKSWATCQREAARDIKKKK